MFFAVFERFPNDDDAGVLWSIVHGLDATNLDYGPALKTSLVRRPSLMANIMADRLERANPLDPWLEMPMYLGSALLLCGIAMQVFAWLFYRRDYPKFWVSRPIWYFLHPKGVVLFIVGVWVALAGVIIYLKGQ